MDYEDMLEKGQEEVPDDLNSESRFEMPELETRKDGSKTVIENFKEFVDKFNREEKHFSKYIQNEMGTAGHIEGSELVLNGKFRRGKINSRIEAYVDDYVFCPECERPDTKLVKEKGVEILKCQACGARNPV
ncbi:translation initiation factor IF-2 subunit beta [Candidatus Haloredivivus sp. G17]|jgi:translation initiation factor 2 subunit 2|nr:translation initiation factor IF-2 subunit beta [Candidatus Haloredivivus sp. G17]